MGAPIALPFQALHPSASTVSCLSKRSQELPLRTILGSVLQHKAQLASLEDAPALSVPVLKSQAMLLL